MTPTISFAQYIQDRTREAWRNWRTSEASRIFLYQHACIKGSRA